ncbi:hypothetical protein MHYP_G00075400 [Metynnis hypsauchen]
MTPSLEPRTLCTVGQKIYDSGDRGGVNLHRSSPRDRIAQEDKNMILTMAPALQVFREVQFNINTESFSPSRIRQINQWMELKMESQGEIQTEGEEEVEILGETQKKPMLLLLLVCLWRPPPLVCLQPPPPPCVVLLEVSGGKLADDRGWGSSGRP